MGAIARIAGMLHLAEHGADDGPKTPVAATTLRSAQRVGDYFKAAAINAFVEMGIDQVTADAVYLLERIMHLGQGEVSERDMQRAAKRLHTKADLAAPLTRLIDHLYLFPMEAPEPTGGRNASPRYRVTQGHKGQKEGRP